MSAFDQRVCEWLNTATIPQNKKQTVLNRVSVSISNYRALEIDRAHPNQAANAAAVANASASASVTQTPRTPKAGGAAAPQQSPAPALSARKSSASAAAGAVTPSSTARGTYKGRSSVTSPFSPNQQQESQQVSPTRSAAGGYAVPQLDVDYALQQRIAKALRRLQEGDEGDSANPLFPYNPKFAHNSNSPNARNNNEEGEMGSEQQQQQYGNDSPNVENNNNNNADENNNVDGEQQQQQDQDGNNNAPNTLYGNEADELDQPFGRPENETGVYTVGFTFGEPSDGAFVGTHGNDDDDENHNANEDNTMTDREDARRRLTMKRKSRNAISAETVDPEAAMAFTAETVPKDEKTRQTIISSLETHHLFSHLDDDDLAFVADIMTVHTFNSGDNIVTKLDPCDDMFIIVEGEAMVTDTVTGDEFESHTSNDVTKSKALRTAGDVAASAAAAASSNDLDGSFGNSSANRNGTRLTVGKTIGDLGLMYHTVQPETVDAVASVSASASPSTTTVCCALNRNAYKNICAKASKVKRERYEGFLANVKFLQGLTKEERLKLADALKGAKYNQGEKIIRYGEEGVWFNIILDGRVDVIGRDADGNPVNVCSFKEGDSVGELEFIYGHKTVADCVAGTPIVKTAKMTANHFEKVIGPAKEVLERRANGDQVYSYYRQTNKVK